MATLRARNKLRYAGISGWIPGISVTTFNPPMAGAAGPTKAEFDELRSCVLVLRDEHNALLAALKAAGLMEPVQPPAG